MNQACKLQLMQDSTGNSDLSRMMADVPAQTPVALGLVAHHTSARYVLELPPLPDSLGLLVCTALAALFDPLSLFAVVEMRRNHPMRALFLLILDSVRVIHSLHISWALDFSRISHDSVRCRNAFFHPYNCCSSPGQRVAVRLPIVVVTYILAGPKEKDSS